MLNKVDWQAISNDIHRPCPGAMNFGTAYGMGPNIQNVKPQLKPMSKRRARQMMSMWEKAFPTVCGWKRRLFGVDFRDIEARYVKGN